MKYTTPCKRKTAFCIRFSVIDLQSSVPTEALKIRSDRLLADNTQETIALVGNSKAAHNSGVTGPDNDHTIWSLSGPEILGPENNHTLFGHSLVLKF